MTTDQTALERLQLEMKALKEAHSQNRSGNREHSDSLIQRLIHTCVYRLLRSGIS
jgi:hypothetical protein